MHRLLSISGLNTGIDCQLHMLGITSEYYRYVKISHLSLKQLGRPACGPYWYNVQIDIGFKVSAIKEHVKLKLYRAWAFVAPIWSKPGEASFTLIWALKFILCAKN